MRTSPRASFKVSVVSAKFPEDQKLAKRSELEIVVRNDEAKRTVPNIAVTVRGFDERRDNKALADPNRPVFVINGVPKEIGTFPESKEAAPEGGETAYVDTWALGPLKAGEEETFRWNVTAVRAGTFKITYEVAAGLDGKAKAVGEGDEPPAGLFAGRISDAAPTPASPTTAARFPDVVGPPFGRFRAASDLARTRGIPAPAAAGTSGTPGRSWTARTSRRSCRACCGSRVGGGSCRTGRREAGSRPEYPPRPRGESAGPIFGQADKADRPPGG